jgi:hypothetical protein
MPLKVLGNICSPLTDLSGELGADFEITLPVEVQV